MKLPDFIQIPSLLIVDKELHQLDWLVYGIIYWCSKLSLQKCILSNERIADMLSSSSGSIANSLVRLTKQKYIKSEYERTTHIRELIPLVAYSTSPASDEHFTCGLSGTSPVGEHNNIYINNIKNIYTHFLEKFNKNPNQYKLTDKRILKIKLRLKEGLTEEQIKLAIDHASEDLFYSGHNDRGWIADLDYIVRNYEITEKLLNLKPKTYGNNNTFKHNNVAEVGKYERLVER